MKATVLLGLVTLLACLALSACGRAGSPRAFKAGASAAAVSAGIRRCASGGQHGASALRSTRASGACCFDISLG